VAVGRRGDDQGSVGWGKKLERQNRLSVDPVRRS
jgi:hypothetical protein